MTWYLTVFPVLGRLNQEDIEFKSSLHYLFQTLSQHPYPPTQVHLNVFPGLWWQEWSAIQQSHLLLSSGLAIKWPDLVWLEYLSPDRIMTKGCYLSLIFTVRMLLFWECYCS